MVKLKHVSAYNTSDVPDHIIEEIRVLTIKMGEVILPLSKDIHPNIFLAALSYVYAVSIKICVSEDPEELKKATLIYSKSILKNMEIISDVRFFEDNK